jgi:hypothetical protein
MDQHENKTLRRIASRAYWSAVVVLVAWPMALIAYTYKTR